MTTETDSSERCTCPPSWWERPTSERPHHHHESCPYFGEPVRDSERAKPDVSAVMNAAHAWQAWFSFPVGRAFDPAVGSPEEQKLHDALKAAAIAACEAWAGECLVETVSKSGALIIALIAERGAARQDAVHLRRLHMSDQQYVSKLIAERDAARAEVERVTALAEQLAAAVDSMFVVGCVLEEHNGPCAISSGMRSLVFALAAWKGRAAHE